MRFINTDNMRWAQRPRPQAFIGTGASHMDALGDGSAVIVGIAREADT